MNTPNKDFDESWVRHLVLDKGFSINDIIAPQNSISMRGSIKAYLNELQVLKIMSMVTGAIGASCGLAGIMIAAPLLAAAGLGVAAAGTIATSKRASAQSFGVLDDQAMRINFPVLQVLGEIENRKQMTSAQVVTVWDSLCAESVRGDAIVEIDPIAFQKRLYKLAEGNISGFNAAGQFEQAMQTGELYDDPDPIDDEFDEEYEPAIATSYASLPAFAVRAEVVGEELNTVAAQPYIPSSSGFSNQPKDKNAEIMEKIRKIAEKEDSYFIAGCPGAGKGILYSNILRWKLEQYPNSLAFVLNPKGDKKEAGYCDHPRIRVFDFRGLTMTSGELAINVIEWMKLAREYMSQADITIGRRLFLVVDELLFLKTNLPKEIFQELIRFTSTSISLGNSEGIHSMVITQSFNSGDGLDSDELMKNLCMVGVFKKGDYARAKKLTQYGKVNADTLSTMQFNTMVLDSPVHRVCCFGGEFYPAPTMTNYSGFNRDEAGQNVASTQTPGKTLNNQQFSTPPEINKADMNNAIDRLEKIGDTETLTAVTQLIELGQVAAAYAILATV